MTEFSVEFELEERSETEAEFELEERREIEPTFELNVATEGPQGPPGQNATINGVNTLNLTATNGVELIQEGDNATISGENLQNQITYETEQRIEAYQHLQEQISLLANGYIHEQGVASAVWTVQHNLDKYPSVTVVDSAENEIVADVEYVDKNSVIIRMTGASKGRAYLN